MAMAIVHASAAQDSLRVGERMPELTGQTLTGRDGRAASGVCGHGDARRDGLHVQVSLPCRSVGRLVPNDHRPTTAVTLLRSTR